MRRDNGVARAADVEVRNGCRGGAGDAFVPEDRAVPGYRVTANSGTAMPMIQPRSRRVALAPEEGGLIAAIAPGSLADELGLVPGHRVVSLNGTPLNDAIDFQFEASNDEVTLEVEMGDELVEFRVDRYAEEVWGITFAGPTF